MICINEKCHSLAFHLQKDLIMLARFRLFQTQKTFPMLLCSWISDCAAAVRQLAYPEASTAERGGIVYVINAGEGQTF